MTSVDATPCQTAVWRKTDRGVSRIKHEFLDTKEPTGGFPGPEVTDELARQHGFPLMRKLVIEVDAAARARDLAALPETCARFSGVCLADMFSGFTVEVQRSLSISLNERERTAGPQLGTLRR